MNLKEMELAIHNIQKDVKALASRPYTERAERATARANEANTGLVALDQEVAESVLALAETMLDFSIELENITKGE